MIAVISAHLFFGIYKFFCGATTFSPFTATELLQLSCCKLSVSTDAADVLATECYDLVAAADVLGSEWSLPNRRSQMLKPNCCDQIQLTSKGIRAEPNRDTQAGARRQDESLGT